MALKLIELYTAICDAPGCEHDLAEDYSGGEYGAMNKSTIESDFAEADWQRVGDSYYCREHWIPQEDLDSLSLIQPEPENADPTPLPPPLFGG